MPLPDPTRDHVRPSASPAEPKSFSTINDGRSDSEIDVPSPCTPGPIGYEMLHEIGRGGMGAVYRARDVRLNRDVAIKFLQEKYSPTSLAAKRFLAEAKITGQLQHPGIPPVHQVGELPDGRPFLAMKLIKGQTLADIVAVKSASRGSLVAVFEKICEAVAYAHNHGVIHRDLKPSNVMVGKFGEVQVMDWGLAKFRNDTRAESAEATVASTFHDPRTDTDEDLHTRTGSFLGTPAYMSPEQAIGAIDNVDERSDVFGLGGILCAILTGQPPFVGATGESTRQLAAEKKLGDAFARLDASGAEPDLVGLAKRCLAGDRDARPGNAGEVARAVARLRADAEQRARQAELDRVRAEGERAKAEEQRRRRRVQLALVGAVAVLVTVTGFGVALAALWQRAEGERETAETARDGEKDARTAAEKAQGEAEKAQTGEEQQRKIAEKERDAARSARDELARTKEVLARVEYGRTIQVAYQHYLDNQIAAARALLAGTREDLRGWEWWYVHRLCHSELQTLKAGYWAVPSPDGDRIVTSSGSIPQVIALKTGAVVGEFKVKSDNNVRPVAYSRDGTRLLTACFDGTLQVWNGQTGLMILELPKPGADYPRSPALSPDGMRIAAGVGNLAKVWAVDTGAVAFELKGHNAGVGAVGFSPDGRWIMTTSADGVGRTWDAKTGAADRVINGLPKSIRQVALNSDGTRALIVPHADATEIWDVAAGKRLFALRGHALSTTAAVFSPDGRWVATASADHTVRLWDAQSGLEQRILKGHTRSVQSVEFFADGKRIVSAGEDLTARVWDVEVPPERLGLRGPSPGATTVVGFSRDGARVVVAGHDGVARIWDVRSGAPQLTLDGHGGTVLSVRFSRNGSRIMTAGLGEAIVWDANTGKKIVAVKAARPGESFASTFSPDGTRIVTTGALGVARVWDATTGAELLVLGGHTGSVLSAAYSPDGKHILTVGQEGTAQLHDAQTGESRFQVKGRANTWVSAAFSFDGAALVVANGESDAQVWDTATGKEKCLLTGRRGAALSAAFSPDGKRVVIGWYDGGLSVHDAGSGAELLQLRGHTDRVLTASYNPEGTRLVSGSIDGTLRIWDAGAGTELLALKFPMGIPHLRFSPDGSCVYGEGGSATLILDRTPINAAFRSRERPPPPREVKLP